MSSNGRSNAVLVAVLVVFMGLPLLVCSGCLLIGIAGVLTSPDKPRKIDDKSIVLSPPIERKDLAKKTDEKLESPPPKKKETHVVYAPIEDMICASDSDFLDSSAINSPANFSRVKKGTPVVITHTGGRLFGKVYYELSAGGDDHIYVYESIFNQKFTKVSTLEVER